MTPDEISKLSNEKLNELIAVKRGYRVLAYDFNGNPEIVIGEDGLTYSVDEIDYAGSWTWAGELLNDLVIYDDIEIMECGSFSSKTGHSYKYQFSVRDNFTVWSESLPRAISEAWYLMEEK